MSDTKPIVVLVAAASPKEAEIVASRIMWHYKHIGIKTAMIHTKTQADYVWLKKLMNRNYQLIIIYNDYRICRNARAAKAKAVGWGDVAVRLSLHIDTDPIVYHQRQYGDDNADEIIDSLIDSYRKMQRYHFGSIRHRTILANGEYGLLKACGVTVDLIKRLKNNQFI